MGGMDTPNASATAGGHRRCDPAEGRTKDPSTENKKSRAGEGIKIEAREGKTRGGLVPLSELLDSRWVRKGKEAAVLAKKQGKNWQEIKRSS